MDLLSEITSKDDDDDQHALRFILPPFSEANDRLHLFTCAFFFSLSKTTRDMVSRERDSLIANIFSLKRREEYVNVPISFLLYTHFY